LHVGEFKKPAQHAFVPEMTEHLWQNCNDDHGVWNDTGVHRLILQSSIEAISVIPVILIQVSIAVFCVVLLCNMLAALAIRLNNVLLVLNKKIANKAGDNNYGAERPFISIHLACYDEPPEIVNAAIDAIATLDYPDFELIVLDNNTPDSARWLPVQHHVDTMPAHYRFYHFDRVTGAKAGALNIAMTLMSTKAQYVAIIDADYCVERDFLLRAISAISQSNADFAQFPQAYRNGGAAPAVCDELGSYFQSVAPSSNPTESMLLTGTLSVISTKCLKAVGGWPTHSITEDAELGLRLYEMGARGVFVDHMVGRGMLPCDIAGLRLQRARWVGGNAQVLRSALFRGGLSFNSRSRSVVCQLTAWVSFIAIPALTLAMNALVPLPSLLVAIATATLIFEAMVISGQAYLASGGQFKKGGAFFIARGALLWTAALSWVPVLWNRSFTFRRTPKENTYSVRWDVLDAPPAVAGLFSVIAFCQGHLVSGGLLALVALPLIASFPVNRRLKNAALPCAV
jgi:cellulose synthase/poly-beta-1,6-N-acetylglucosamine synthase-like glycosyltransferase